MSATGRGTSVCPSTGGWNYREAFTIVWGGSELTDQFDFLTEAEEVRKKVEALIDRRFPPEAK